MKRAAISITVVLTLLASTASVATAQWRPPRPPESALQGRLGYFFLDDPDDGFWADTLTSLAKATLYDSAASDFSVSSLCVLAAIGVMAAIAMTAARFQKEGLTDPVSRRIAVLGILLLCIVAIELQHLLLGTKFLIGRTAVFFLPLFGLVLSFACEDIARMHKASLALPIGLALLSAANLASNANLTHTRDWRYEADTKAMVGDVAALIAAKPTTQANYTITANWFFAPTVNFYRIQLGIHNQGRLVEMTGAGIKGGYDFYYLDRPELRQLKRLKLKTKNTYPFTSRLLAVPRKADP